jgi:hypothetical protein
MMWVGIAFLRIGEIPPQQPMGRLTLHLSEGCGRAPYWRRAPAGSKLFRGV